MLRMLAAVALKVVVAEPAGTVTVDAGTGSSALLLDSETALPPEGAPAFRFTVHVALAPEVKLVELQVREESATTDTMLMVAVCVTPLRVAVSVTVKLLKIAPAEVLMVVVAEPAGTVTADGTRSSSA